VQLLYAPFVLKTDPPSDPTLVDAVYSLKETRTDGRTARGERARKSIAEALISLLQDGTARPTARQVADRAGVSQRLVFHHFEDMESLLEAAVSVQVERHWQKLGPIGPQGDLHQRVTETVSQRASLFEAIAPVRRAAAHSAGRSPTLARQLELSRVLLRAKLRDTFSSELSIQAEPSTCGESETLDALEVAASFETWDQLRNQSGRSVAASRRIMEHLLLGVLGQPRRSETTTHRTDRS
jgi:TetR/AcrR family transcriptional regulator, regulator of autoinduction and epiphytic fitness